MKKLTTYLLLALTLLSCSPAPKAEEKENVPEPPVDTPDPKEPQTPQEQDPAPEGKPRYVWIDASANFHYYANDKAYIGKEIKQLADCGFTDIIVDVRPTEGTVLWKSAIAPQAKRLAAWVNSSYRFVERTATWDYLQAFIDAGHAAGLRVHAAINTFVCGYGGYYGLESEGPVFDGLIPEDWTALDHTADGLTRSFHPGVQGTVFLNPAKDEVQEYIIGLLKALTAAGMMTPAFRPISRKNHVRNSLNTLGTSPQNGQSLRQVSRIFPPGLETTRRAGWLSAARLSTISLKRLRRPFIP